MKKSLFAICAFLFMMIHHPLSFAQTNPVELGVHFESVLPFGRFSNLNPVGLGGVANVNYLVKENVAINVESGYLWFPGKTRVQSNNYKVRNPYLRVVPVRVGARYLFGEQIPLFLQGQVGAAIVTARDNYGFGNTVRSRNYTYFTLSPAFGYRKNNVEFLVKYEGWMKNEISSFLGAQIGFYF